jgi:hypothetical protein
MIVSAIAPARDIAAGAALSDNLGGIRATSEALRAGLALHRAKLVRMRRALQRLFPAVASDPTRKAGRSGTVMGGFPERRA